MSIFFEILVPIASYGPHIDQSHGENRLSHIINDNNNIAIIVIIIIIIIIMTIAITIIMMTISVYNVIYRFSQS